MIQVGTILGSILSTLGEAREDLDVKGRHQLSSLIGDTNSKHCRYVSA